LILFFKFVCIASWCCECVIYSLMHTCDMTQLRLVSSSGHWIIAHTTLTLQNKKTFRFFVFLIWIRTCDMTRPCSVSSSARCMSELLLAPPFLIWNTPNMSKETYRNPERPAKEIYKRDLLTVWTNFVKQKLLLAPLFLRYAKYVKRDLEESRGTY